jgi:hypothetical protein
MFAPKVERSQPKTDRFNHQLAPRSPVRVAQLGDGSESAVQPGFDHSVRSQRSGSGINVDQQMARERADQGQPPLQNAAVPSFDFGKISIFPPSQQPSSALPVVQPKLAVGAVNDPLQQEAGRIADQVMRMPDPGLSAPLKRSRKCAACEQEEEKLQREPKAKIVSETQGPSESELVNGGGRLLPAIQKAAIPSWDCGRASTFPPTQQTSPVLPRLQAKLAAATVHDPLEQEADRVADQVMRMSDPSLSIAPAPLKLSRKCAACEQEEEKLQREPKSEDAGEIQGPPESELIKGGERLPPEAAEFFETRFGRDFSAVRVHTGETAKRYNDAVNAYAFTYGSHIWLGPGLRLQPSPILAHELAHVVQQTQPAPLASAPLQPDLSLSHRIVQRFAPYWMPSDFVVSDRDGKPKVGTKTHQLVLPVIGKSNEIFTEAPVPNADRKSEADGKVGIADFCQSTTDSEEPITVGVYFLGKGNPKELTSNWQLKYEGQRYDHKGNSAPRADEKRRSVIHALGAPTKIFVGDLKPPYDTPDAAGGAEQIRNYLAGFNLARDRVNEMSVGEGGFEQTDAKWPKLKTGIINLQIPPQFPMPPPRGDGLVLVYRGDVYHPPKGEKQVPGKVHVRHSAQGIWSYRWKPDRDVPAAELETYEHTRGMDVRRLIVDPLLVSQLQINTKARPARAASKLTQTSRRIQAREREIADEDAKDPFDKTALETWERNHKRLSGEEKELEKKPEFKIAEFESLVTQERQAAIESGFPFPPISKAGKEAVKGLKQIQFWTKPSTIILGKLRYWFGGLFVKVANAYRAIRAKFQELLHGKSSPESGGLTGTIIKIAFQVLKIVARFMIDRTAGYLIQSLKTGVGNKLRSLIPEEGIEEFEAKVAEFERVATDLEQRAKETIEGWVGSIIGPYAGYINTIEEAARTLSTINDMIDKVKWGARVVACLSPPAWGCLWILAQSVLEKFASWLIDRCWFKKEILPLVMSISDFVASLPKKLAAFIIKGIKGFLPKDLGEVLADPSEVDKDEDIKKAIPPNEICGIDDRYLRPPFLVEEGALAELRKEIGEDKWEAWTKLAKLYGGVNYGNPLTEEQIAQLKKELKKATLPALKGAADLFGAFTPTKQVTNVTGFLEEAERVREEMQGGGVAGAEGGGEGGISVFASEKAPAGEYKPTKLGFNVVSGVTRGVYKGDTIKVVRAANIKGTEVTLEGVEVVVQNRVLVPNEANPEKIVVDLEVTKDQYFNVEEKYGAEAVKKIGYKSFQYRKGVKFSYTLQLRTGRAE